uniref:Uncharacterized protein n=1 Tax=Sphaerodactylus townsendi TaxID=933632 RepID=A0ACB8ET59_9SAUR
MGRGGERSVRNEAQCGTRTHRKRLDAKKSPLALLAQTCSQDAPDPSPSSKLSSVASSGSDKESSKSGPLKLSDIGVEDKSSFKPTPSRAWATRRELRRAGRGAPPSGSRGRRRRGEKTGCAGGATCQPFTLGDRQPHLQRRLGLLAWGLLPGTPRAAARPTRRTRRGPTAAPRSRRRLGFGGPGARGTRAPRDCWRASSGASASETPCGGGWPPCRRLLVFLLVVLCRRRPPSSLPVRAELGPGGAGLALQGRPERVPAAAGRPGATRGAGGLVPGYPPQFLPHGVALDPSKPGSMVGGLGCGGPCDKRFASRRKSCSATCGRTTAFPGTDKLLAAHLPGSSLAAAMPATCTPLPALQPGLAGPAPPPPRKRVKWGVSCVFQRRRDTVRRAEFCRFHIWLLKSDGATRLREGIPGESGVKLQRGVKAYTDPSSVGFRIACLNARGAARC